MPLHAWTSARYVVRGVVYELKSKKTSSSPHRDWNEPALPGPGMGSSKAAELNHYPGPAHVIADSTRLGLTDKQKTETLSVFDAMSLAAERSGAAIVAKEAELDALYAADKRRRAPSRNSSPLAGLQAEFRYAHLSAHLAMRTILTPEQIARYDEMRGYTATVTNSSGSEAVPAHQRMHD